MSNCGLELVDTSSVIPDETVDFVISMLEGSQAVATLEKSLTRSTGRPRSLGPLAVLVGLILLAIDDRPLYLKGLTDLLYCRISNESRIKLNVKGDADTPLSFNASYRRVRYVFGLCSRVVDPSPLKKNRCIDHETLIATSIPMTDTEIKSATVRLLDLVNSLVQASVSVLSEKELSTYDGSIGLDATVVPLFSRGPSKTRGICASDPDGGWYVREGDHRDAEDNKGKKRTRIAWALEATFATMAPSDSGSYPNLAIGLALGRPGVDPGGTGVAVLASVAKRHFRTGDVGADRAYSCADPSKFHLPLRALGYQMVMDYRIDQLGRQANSSGALLVEGTWYCPQIPEGLIQATIDYRSNRINETTYRSRIEARRSYALVRKESPDNDGYERYSCPALGKRPRVMCPIRPSSGQIGISVPKVFDAPSSCPPKICSQGSITIAGNVGVRHRQELTFGSELWAKRYSTLRNTIEGLNGYIKDPAHEALGISGRRRVRGIAAQAIFVAVLTIAANLRKIAAFREKVTQNIDVQPKRTRRRRTSLTDYIPN